MNEIAFNGTSFSNIVIWKCQPSSMKIGLFNCRAKVKLVSRHSPTMGLTVCDSSDSPMDANVLVEETGSTRTSIVSVYVSSESSCVSVA